MDGNSNPSSYHPCIGQPNRHSRIEHPLKPQRSHPPKLASHIAGCTRIAQRAKCINYSFNCFSPVCKLN